MPAILSRQHRDTRARRVWTFISAGLLVAVLVASCAWAAATVMRPIEDPAGTTKFTYVTVEQGEVGAVLSLYTVAEWTPTPAGVNRAAGVVTGVLIEEGDQVGQGAVLYTVDLKPVVLARGDVPMFRELGLGLEGEDVAQLQTMLRELGFYGAAIDGKAEGGTVRAIEAWQKSLGIVATGRVGVGDVIFVPTLPARVSLSGDVVGRGATLVGGEAALQVLSPAPQFRIPAGEGQAAMMPAGTRVEIDAPDGSLWEGVVAAHQPDEETGGVMVTVSAKADALVCGDGCAQVPVAEKLSLSSRIITVEPAAGLVVPSAAIVTDSTGGLALIDRKGRRHSVAIVASARGMSVVTGVDAGLAVRIPGDAGDAEPDQ